MKYEEIITSMNDQYLMAVTRIKKEIINILKENGNIIDIGSGCHDTPVITMWDGNGYNDDVEIKAIELIEDGSIYVNGISNLNGTNVSYEAFSDHYFWLLEFIQIWDKANN